jgi:P27 family predicted phage terminase small subunit
MGGPAPIPNERKRRAGNPGKRPLPDESKVILLPEIDHSAVPPHLGPGGADLWVMIAEYASKWLAPSDLPSLLLLCELEDRRHELMATLQNDGWVLYTDKMYAYQHPAAGMLASSETQMVKLFSLLGLTPADRTKMGLAEVRAQSKLQQLREAQQGKG